MTYNVNESGINFYSKLFFFLRIVVIAIRAESFVLQIICQDPHFCTKCLKIRLKIQGALSISKC